MAWGGVWYNIFSEKDTPSWLELGYKVTVSFFCFVSLSRSSPQGWDESKHGFFVFSFHVSPIMYVHIEVYSFMTGIGTIRDDE